MRTLRLVAAVGIVAVLAACDKAPVSPPDREPHPIEGTWEVVELTATSADGSSTTLDLRNQSLTMTFDNGAYTGKGSLAAYPEPSPDATITGTYVLIEETRTLVITSQGSSLHSAVTTQILSYGMRGDDKLDLLERNPPGRLGGSQTFHLERMDSN